MRSRKLSQGLAYSRNASQCIVGWRVSWLDGWLMGPLQQGSKEARSMPELKDRLEGLLEALFMRILDSTSHATFGALGAFAMRSMRAWAGFQFCQASSFLSI